LVIADAMSLADNVMSAMTISLLRLVSDDA